MTTTTTVGKWLMDSGKLLGKPEDRQLVVMFSGFPPSWSERGIIGLAQIFIVHWKPDIRIPFIPEENGLTSGLFLYAIHTVDKLLDFVLGENRLMTDLFLYPVILYLVSSAILTPFSGGGKEDSNKRCRYSPPTPKSVTCRRGASSAQAVPRVNLPSIRQHYTPGPPNVVWPKANSPVGLLGHCLRLFQYSICAGTHSVTVVKLCYSFLISLLSNTYCNNETS